MTKYTREAVELAKEMLNLIEERNSVGPAVKILAREAVLADKTARRLWAQANRKQKRLDEIEVELVAKGYDLPPRPDSWIINFDDAEYTSDDGYTDPFETEGWGEQDDVPNHTGGH